jgi:uncharacterized membrane protein YeiB
VDQALLGLLVYAAVALLAWFALRWAKTRASALSHRVLAVLRTGGVDLFVETTRNVPEQQAEQHEAGLLRRVIASGGLALFTEPERDSSQTGSHGST